MEEGKTNIKLELIEELLLYYLIDNKIKEIAPVIYYDVINYDIVKNFDEYHDKETFDELLDGLKDKGYFEKKEYDRVIRCFNCHSVNQQTKYNCPQCKSTRVRRFELIEHTDCGFIGELDEFKEENGDLVCPKCSKEFKENSKAYEVIGISYICDDCGYKFDKPDTSHHCQNCGQIYDYTNSIYTKLYSYTLTDKITELIPVREIRETLRTLEAAFVEKEYEVELEGVLVGKSQEEKILSLIARKEPETIIIDISPWGKQENIITLLGKKMDLEPQEAIMIDLSEENKLAPMEDIYKIKVYHGKDPELSTKISSLIDELNPIPREPRRFFSPKREVQQETKPEPKTEPKEETKDKTDKDQEKVAETELKEESDKQPDEPFEEKPDESPEMPKPIPEIDSDEDESNDETESEPDSVEESEEEDDKDQ